MFPADSYWSWAPKTCSNGHPIGPGNFSQTFVTCGCPAADDGRGHHLVTCGDNACRSPFIGPPGCDREWPR